MSTTMSTTPTVAATATPAVNASLAIPANKPSTAIWNTDELAILRLHIDGYKAEVQERRGKYVAKKVYALIKALWADRYNEEKMGKDKAIRDEWKKKKSVSMPVLYNVN